MPTPSVKSTSVEGSVKSTSVAGSVKSTSVAGSGSISPKQLPKETITFVQNEIAIEVPKESSNLRKLPANVVSSDYIRPSVFLRSR